MVGVLDMTTWFKYGNIHIRTKLDNSRDIYFFNQFNAIDKSCYERTYQIKYTIPI